MAGVGGVSPCVGLLNTGDARESQQGVESLESATQALASLLGWQSGLCRH